MFNSCTCTCLKVNLHQIKGFFASMSLTLNPKNTYGASLYKWNKKSIKYKSD